MNDAEHAPRPANPRPPALDERAACFPGRGILAAQQFGSDFANPSLTQNLDHLDFA